MEAVSLLSSCWDVMDPSMFQQVGCFDELSKRAGARDVVILK